MEAFRDIGCIEILRAQRDLWRSGRLAPEWARIYGPDRPAGNPQLFDEDDVRLVESQGQYGGHHIEWLAAIVLYHTTSYLSLVSKYEFANHRRKREIVEKVLPPDVLSILRDRTVHGPAQGPDLLMYARDFSDWFFCEVKGPGDYRRPEQDRKFEALARVTRKPVRFLYFKWAPM